MKAKNKNRNKDIPPKRFKPTAQDVANLHKEAESLVKKPNVKKYNFPVEKVYKMLHYLFVKNNGNFHLKDSYKFAAGYCDTNDTNFKEVNAIIKLMRKYRPNEMVVTSLAKGKKVLIVGDVAKELLVSASIDWNESHISSAGVKIPIKLSLKKKLKTLGNETLGGMIKECE